MRRLLWLLVLLLTSLGIGSVPARADDISAAARGVVRVVTIATAGENQDVIDFSHGSGFAVAPNRVVTNFHVVRLVERYPGNVVIGIVPSEGDKSYAGRLVAWDEARDLALIEFTGVRLPALTLFNAPVQEGDQLFALGYPGNVDRATAESAADFITPQSPVRSQGNLSGFRRLGGFNALVHSAGIARGNSGGPLMDRCGRVLGVNRAVTNNESGDASFAFAIPYSELSAFLEANKQSYASVNIPCVSIEDRLRQDADADAQARARAEEEARLAEARSSADRASALQQARQNNEATRENFMAIAAVMLVLGGLCFGGAGLLLSRNQQREAIWVAAGGAVLFIGAVVLFLNRPTFDESKVVPVAKSTAPPELMAPAAGKLTCTLQPERSRVIYAAADTVALDVGGDGCINGRTQYSEDSKRWLRVLVPEQEPTVSVLEFDPVARTYTNTRYLLRAEQMTRVRQLRAEVKLKTCSNDQAARGNLATQQQSIRAALPRDYNEKLVYRCATAQ